MEPKMLKIWGSATAAGSVICFLEAATGPPASALDRQIQLTNDTRIAIVELYAARVATGRWQQDILGEDFLPPGNSLVIKIDDETGYCRYDLKAVLDDGTTVIHRNINVCSLDRYAIR
jgi:hypothetical protein